MDSEVINTAKVYFQKVREIEELTAQVKELKAENEELRDWMDFQIRKARAGSHSLEQVWKATMAEFDKWIQYAKELEKKVGNA